MCSSRACSASRWPRHFRRCGGKGPGGGGARSGGGRIGCAPDSLHHRRFLVSHLRADDRAFLRLADHPDQFHRASVFQLAGRIRAGRRHKLFEIIVYCTFGFLGITLALRSNREEFAFLIPYVRFRQEGVEEQRLLVDTNILIDGRLPGICETGFLNASLVVPRFVLDELHLLADSPDPIRRERGNAWPRMPRNLARQPDLDVKIHEEYQPQDRPVDMKLVQLARTLGARLLTNDANLGRVAALQSVPVLNLNALAKAMRPAIIPGDEVELTLIKEGRDPHQAVGYLPDGTMIVVNHASTLMGQSVPVVVSSALQTTAGRLVFAELKSAARR